MVCIALALACHMKGIMQQFQSLFDPSLYSFPLQEPDGKWWKGLLSRTLEMLPLNAQQDLGKLVRLNSNLILFKLDHTGLPHNKD